MASVSLSVSPSGILFDTAPRGGWDVDAEGGRVGELGRLFEDDCFGQTPQVSSGPTNGVDFGFELWGAGVRTMAPRRGGRLRRG